MEKPDTKSNGGGRAGFWNNGKWQEGRMTGRAWEHCEVPWCNGDDKGQCEGEGDAEGKCKGEGEGKVEDESNGEGNGEDKGEGEGKGEDIGEGEGKGEDKGEH